jgi:hypothetical protein
MSRTRLDIPQPCIGLGCDQATSTAMSPLPVGRNMPGARAFHLGTPKQRSSSQISRALMRRGYSRQSSGANVTTFCATPTVWRMLVTQRLADYKTKLRELVSAGEPLNPEIIDQVHMQRGVSRFGMDTAKQRAPQWLATRQGNRLSRQRWADRYPGSGWSSWIRPTKGLRKVSSALRLIRGLWDRCQATSKMTALSRRLRESITGQAM